MGSVCSWAAPFPPLCHTIEGLKDHGFLGRPLPIMSHNRRLKDHGFLGRLPPLRHTTEGLKDHGFLLFRLLRASSFFLYFHHTLAPTPPTRLWKENREGRSRAHMLTHQICTEPLLRRTEFWKTKEPGARDQLGLRVQAFVAR